MDNSTMKLTAIMARYDPRRNKWNTPADFFVSRFPINYHMNCIFTARYLMGADSERNLPGQSTYSKISSYSIAIV